MHKFDDFTYKEIEFEEAAKELPEVDKSNSKLITELYFQIIDLENSQYVEIADEGFVNRLKTDIYDAVKEAACLCNGKSEIEFNEENGVCYITLYSKFLFLNEAMGISTSEAAALIKQSTWTKASVVDEYIKFELMFSTNRKVKVADHSEKIEALKKQIKNNSRI